MSALEIKNLHVKIEDKEIIKGINLKVRQGETHAIMGPNGSGKSTLAYTIMGHPNYRITKGKVLFDGKNIINLTPNKRAEIGLFLAFQYPYDVHGVTISNFLRTAYQSIKKDTPLDNFYKILEEKRKLLKVDDAFVGRYLNDGFSGGEKKKCEILQLAVLQPKIAILDETDSGLDIDALKIVANSINKLVNANIGFLVITHYQRILKYLNPDYVHVMIDGKIVESGDKKLSEKLEKHGYEWINNGGDKNAKV